MLRATDPPYNADPSGTSDSTAALQWWLNDAIRYSSPFNPQDPVLFGRYGSGVAYLPKGKYRITAPLRVYYAESLRVVGEGLASWIFYDGPTGQPVWDLRQCRACRWHDLTVMSNTGRTALAAFRQANQKPNYTPNPKPDIDVAIPPFPPENSVCEWHNVRVGGAYGGFTYGWDIDTAAVGDTVGGNNEEHKWFSCQAYGYGTAAFRLNGANTLGCRFHDCLMDGESNFQPSAPYGVLCEYASHFYWYGGFGGYHTGADFNVRNQLIQASIERWNSENSARLFLTGPPDLSGRNLNVIPTTIRDCRWVGNVPDDQEFIQFLCAGPLTVVGNYFATWKDNTRELRIRFNPFPYSPGGSTSGGVIHEGNSYTLNTDPTNSAILDFTGGSAKIRDSTTNVYTRAGSAVNKFFSIRTDI